MIVNPILSGGTAGAGAQAVIGTCTLYDLTGTAHAIPIYQGVAPLDGIAFFETINDVEQIAGGQAEYVSWASLASGDYLFYRGVQDGDQFEEKVL